jgi:hypothetical protein
VSVVAVIVSAVMGVGVGFALSTLTPGTVTPVDGRSDQPVDAGGSAEPSPSASAPAVASASAVLSASVSASASAAPPASPEACALSFFPPETFRAESPSLGFVCETGTFPASRRLKKLVVQSGAGTVNDAMREWSRLGYYQLAATAALQQRCCASVPAYELPPIPEGCKLEPALDAVRGWAGTSAESEIEAVTQTFTKAARCVARSVEGKAFDFEPPSGGQDLVFRKTLERVR